MITPSQALDRLRARFELNYPKWVLQRGNWPLQIPLQPPSAAERRTNPVACRTWAEDWRAYEGPGTVHYANAQFLTGIIPMPQRLDIESAAQAALAHPATRATWQRCSQRLPRLQEALPRARFDTRAIKDIVELDQDEYERLFATATWLNSHPTSGFLLRQLPIEGIDTKWLEKHESLVLKMLGTHESAPDEPTPADAPREPVTRRGRLHERLGLRPVPQLVQVAVLDPVLRAPLGGMRHFAASVEDLNSWPESPTRVLILENKETAYALTGDYPGCVVLHGHGFHVHNYARIRWVRAASSVVYWGDIDTPGLEFLNDLRALGVPAISILMDTATLHAFRHLSTTGSTPRRTALPWLTAPERELLNELVEHAQLNVSGLLLEQERVPWSHALATLEPVLTPCAGQRASEDVKRPDREERGDLTVAGVQRHEPPGGTARTSTSEIEPEAYARG